MLLQEREIEMSVDADTNASPETEVFDALATHDSPY
jgi:hypothetical protein